MKKILVLLLTVFCLLTVVSCKYEPDNPREPLIDDEFFAEFEECSTYEVYSINKTTETGWVDTFYRDIYGDDDDRHKFVLLNDSAHYEINVDFKVGSVYNEYQDKVCTLSAPMLGTITIDVTSDTSCSIKYVGTFEGKSEGTYTGNGTLSNLDSFEITNFSDWSTTETDILKQIIKNYDYIPSGITLSLTATKEYELSCYYKGITSGSSLSFNNTQTIERKNGVKVKYVEDIVRMIILTDEGRVEAIKTDKEYYLIDSYSNHLILNKYTINGKNYKIS